MRFGIPSVIISDNGSEFNNQLNVQLMELLGNDYRLTTPYHRLVLLDCHTLRTLLGTVTCTCSKFVEYLKNSCMTHFAGPYIDVDTHVPKNTANIWITNSSYTLLDSDRDILLDPVGWLNTSLIAAAQFMLIEEHGHMGALQDPILAKGMKFTVEDGEFVVLHDGHGHWLTVTNIGAERDTEVLVYDSLYPSIGSFVQKEIAAILSNKTERSR